MLFIISIFCILAVIPFRFSCNTAVEDILIALEVILLSLSSLYYARGFRAVCNFVYNLHRILGYDMVRFFSIYFIFMISFSQTFFLILQKLNPYMLRSEFTNPIESIIDTIVLTLGEVTVAYEIVEFPSSYAIIGAIYTMIFMLLGSLLLVNMLIAMMDHTQEITNGRKTEWIRQWGRQILVVEQNINPKERLKQQVKYTNSLKSGEKGLIVKWKQNEEERNEFKSKKEIFQKYILNNFFKFD
ncbi:transient receptor potential cation channel subfamily V member 5-like [Brachionus plicatilis]|uniref:Transient receptor potential cation channel subfamily V member 5-like n=1 Tax=Brachionus plicatilis TaxID=10195 RepID=A0A3M7R969_BRAPC|nr:transient receptor potential cation channel subfamily V member 5-like [Brachionus plicatilis]